MEQPEPAPNERPGHEYLTGLWYDEALLGAVVVAGVVATLVCCACCPLLRRAFNRWRNPWVHIQWSSDEESDGAVDVETGAKHFPGRAGERDIAACTPSVEVFDGESRVEHAGEDWGNEMAICAPITPANGSGEGGSVHTAVFTIHQCGQTQDIHAGVGARSMAIGIVRADFDPLI